MKNEKNKELNSATPAKSAEPMFEPVQSNRFVVIRDGHRVSDREYSYSDDESALQEQAFWNKIATVHSCGEKVEIVPYDIRKHRVW